MNLSSTLSLLFSVLLLNACVHTKPEGARLSRSEAIQIVKDSAKQHGRTLRHYKRREAIFNRRARKWDFFFEGRVRFGLFLTPGDHFSATVDDQTGDVVISPGR